MSPQFKNKQNKKQSQKRKDLGDNLQYKLLTLHTPETSSSVTKILNMSHKVDMALPGHNDVLNRNQLVEACEGHIQSCGKWRTLRKTMSRTRASVVLAINARQNIPLPSATRHVRAELIVMIFFVKLTLLIFAKVKPKMMCP